jgi:plasmid maintenance system antidote protein VapI
MRFQERSKVIAKRLRMARIAASVGLAEASRLIKVTQPSLTAIEKGKQRVAAEHVVRLVEHYGANLQWVLGLIDD